MKEIAERLRKWKEGKDEGHIYDEAFTFFDDLSRGEMLSIMDFIEANA